MAEPAREELSALAAIFCGPDEWEVLSRSGDCPAPQGPGVLPLGAGTGRTAGPRREPSSHARGGRASRAQHPAPLRSRDRASAVGAAPAASLCSVTFPGGLRLWRPLLRRKALELPGPDAPQTPVPSRGLPSSGLLLALFSMIVKRYSGPACDFQFQLLRLLSSNPETDGTVFRILTKAEGLTGADVPLELVFHLPVNYPSCLPGISVHSKHLTRAQSMTVKEKLLKQAENLLSEPMIHELVLWIQQNLRHILNQLETGSGSEKCTFATGMTVDDGLWITLLHLDHMRAKTKYVKTVEKWASDLKLTGRLMFMGKIILILLQGDRSNIKVPKILTLNMNLAIFCKMVCL
uniref:RWD domain-containing protein 3 n=2 Tax=Canis lupus familiaris TaxID=9615 RepID=A0A8P0PHZ8_CANLF